MADRRRAEERIKSEQKKFKGRIRLEKQGKGTRRVKGTVKEGANQGWSYKENSEYYKGLYANMEAREGDSSTRKASQDSD